MLSRDFSGSPQAFRVLGLVRQLPGGPVLARVIDDNPTWLASAKPHERILSGSVPVLEDAATLGAIEHGLLAPLGIWIEQRVRWDSAPVREYRPGVSDVQASRTEWFPDLATALIVALEGAP